MKLWIARDKDGSLNISTHKQVYIGGVVGWDNPKEYYDDDYSFDAYINESLFPEVTFENSPQEVELTLCNHIDTVNIQDWDPKKQTCVMTNHGVTTDVIFK